MLEWTKSYQPLFTANCLRSSSSVSLSWDNTQTWLILRVEADIGIRSLESGMKLEVISDESHSNGFQLR